MNDFESDVMRTGGEIHLSNFDENPKTPSTQLLMEAMESKLIPDTTQKSDDGALLHLGEQSTIPVAQAMLGEKVHPDICNSLRRVGGD